MKFLKIFSIIALQFSLFSITANAQCPASIASLGQGNGLQLCWPRNEAPTVLDSIIYDGVTYSGRFVNGGQGDCWRTIDAASLGVNGNHVLEVIIDGLPGSTCTVDNGVVTDPLPISLAYFVATAEKNAVLIEWQTMEEENNDYFQIERSRDGVEYEVIAKVDGAGSSNDIQFYEIEDETATYQKGIYYYRLKQVDFDGSFSHSDIVAIEIEKSLNFELTRVFPNPARNQINVLLNLNNTGQAQITIMDMTGRLVVEQVIDNGVGGIQTVPFNIETLQAGCYIVRVQSGETVKSTQFIKL